jgi:hypothetical protein
MKEDYLEDYMQGKMHKYPMFFFKVTKSQYTMLVDQGILSKKAQPIHAAVATAHGDITNIQFSCL